MPLRNLEILLVLYVCTDQRSFCSAVYFVKPSTHGNFDKDQKAQLPLWHFFFRGRREKARGLLSVSCAAAPRFVAHSPKV